MITNEYTLLSVGELIRGVTFSKSEASKEFHASMLPVLRSGNVQRELITDSGLLFIPKDKPRDRQMLQKWDIVISVSNSRELVGKSAIATTSWNGTFGAFLTTLRVDRKIADPRYIYYTMQTKQWLNAITQNSTATNNIANINNSRLGALTVRLPSLKEQEEIVAKIEELFSEIDNFASTTPKTMELFARYKLSILAQAFTGKLTENDLFEIRQDIVVDDDLTKELPELPKAWRYVKLKGLGELARGKSKHRPRNDPRLFGGPYPFLQTGEVKASGGLITEYEKTYSDFGLAQSKLWPRGTLCITIAANIAETAFLDFDACFPDSVVGFAANPELVLPKYVKYFIELSKERIERFAPATAQKNINLKTLEELVVPLCSLQEQQKIIDVIESKFSETNNLADVILNVNTQGQRVKQSILSKAFKGELV